MINRFRDSNRFLSNYYPANVSLDGKIYPSVEHAFQAAKTDNELARNQIRDALSPSTAKRLGKNVKLRPDWEEIKLAVMMGLLCQKFTTPHLRKMLIDTGVKELVEGNHWGDTYWGVCNGVGQNHLGKLLMTVRDLVGGEQL